jgi:uncharacterized protein (DUF2147 family)
MRSGVLALAAVVTLISAANADDGATPGAIGFWVTQDHSSVVEISPCGAGLCGQVVGLRAGRKPDDPATDTHNPDPAKRGAALCGLVMMGGLTPVKGSVGKWEGGWIYDPESGDTYSAEMRLTAADRLTLRGYLGMPLFGRSENWTREGDGPKNRCAIPAK